MGRSESTIRRFDRTLTSVEPKLAPIDRLAATSSRYYMLTAATRLSIELPDDIDESARASLQQRLGPLLAKQRLRLEIEQRLKTRKGISSLRLEN
jgi:hypothetical protein